LELSHPQARAQLTLDEGGQALLVVGHCLSLGHAQSGAAHIPLWGDLGERVLEFTLRESFHGGARWQVRALGKGESSEPLDLDSSPGIPIGSAGTVRLSQPDPASAAAVLELHGNLDAEGARRVLLVPPGSGGALRFGPTSDCHLFWQGADPQAHVHLSVCGEYEDLRLHLDCGEGLRLPDAGSAVHWEMPFPPRDRVEVLLGDLDSSQPPCALCLSPSRPPTIDPGSR